MKRTFAVLALLTVLLGACVWNEPVGTSEQAVWVDGGKPGQCVGPGVYTGDILNAYQELHQIRIDTMNFVISDPEVATSNNQLVGVDIGIQVRRKADCESLVGMLTNYPAIANDDAQVLNLITPSVLEGMKNGVRGFELNALLSDRNGLGSAINDSVAKDVNKFGLEIIAVQVKNVALAPAYVQILQETSNLSAQKDLKLREQDVIRQAAANAQFEQEQKALTLAKQLVAEQKQTEIDVEIAKREGAKTAASQQVYSLNPQAFELEKLRLMAKIFGDKTTYFLPFGTDVTMLMNGFMNNVTPVPTAVPTP